MEICLEMPAGPSKFLLANISAYVVVVDVNKFSRINFLLNFLSVESLRPKLAAHDELLQLMVTIA